MAWFLTHPVDAEDVQSVWDWIFLVVALGICASAGALTHRRFVFAFVVLFGFVLGSMLFLELLSAIARARIWSSVSLVFVFAAVTGTLAFSVVSRRPVTLIVGALSGVTGLTIVGIFNWTAWEIWPRRLTELEPANFATLIAVGPIMGLALGVPFAVVEKKAARDQNMRGTN